MPPKKTTKTTKTTAPKATPQKSAPEEVKPEDLLNDVSDASTSDESSRGAVDFENAELEALRAQLAEAQAQLALVQRDPVPTPEYELSAEQRELRSMQDQLARSNGQKIETIEEIFEDGDATIIHILEDGFTFAGRTWYRGQEVEIGPRAFEDSKNRLGVSFLSMDDEAQYKAYGKVFFRKGPWPGQRTYEDGAEIKRISAPVTQI